jgi:carboxyl-terminal processing protease
MKRFVGSLLVFACALSSLQAWAPRPSEPAPATPETQADKPAETKPAPPAPKAATLDPKFRQVAVVFAKFLEQEHFAKRPIDENLTKEWIEAYLKDLDYNRLFFLQSDVDALVTKFGPTLAADLKRGEISPSLEIFQLFEKRLAERMTWVKARLQQPFEFSKDETYNPDRSKSPWPRDAAEAQQLWERRLKNEYLAERLAYEDRSKEKEKDPKKVKTPEPPAEKLQKRYDRFAKNIEEMTTEEVIEFYLTALARIYDPHSQYLGPDTLEDFAISMKNSLFGIGAVLTVNDGYCTIKEIMPGGPAAIDNRLQPGDRIAGVAQGPKDYVDIVDMRLRNAVKLIRGPKGSEVRLKVIPANAPDASVRKEISLIRDEIKITNQRAKAEIIEIPGQDGKPPLRAGIIQIPSFYGPIERGSGPQSSTTTEDVQRLLGKLKEDQVNGVILDLRNNGGGLLSEAVLLTGLFIDRGPVVQIKDSRGRKHVLEDLESGTAYDGPLVILTNKMSASASEIVAGALQNYGRALVVGDKSTHGKGTVQTVQELGRYLSTIGTAPNAGAVKLTIQKFYLPNGHSTQMRGVIPDIVLPTPNDYLDLGEDRLPHALEWDEIEGERFRRDNTLVQGLPLLQERSALRIRDNAEFTELSRDIERLRRRLDNPEISLNEKSRIQERAEDKARRDAREATLKRLAEKAPLVTRISFDSNESLKITTEDEPDAAAENAESGEGLEDSTAKKLTRSEQFAADLHLQETLFILRDLVGQRTGPPAKPAAVAAQVPASS